MGKSSRGKRQKELQAKSTLKDKPLKIEGTSSKWSLFHKLPLHFLLIAIVGFLAYFNTFNVPFHFDDTNNIVENYKLRDLSNFWPPAGSRWVGFLTFALNYKLGGLDTTGYHIVNLTIHILNAILVYWLVVLTYRTPYFKVSVISASVSNQPNQFNLSTFKPLNYLPLFIALLFVSHPIQTQAVTYIVQRFTSLATMFYLLSLVMYIKARLGQTTEAEVKAKVKFFSTSTLTFYFLSVLSAILAMKTKEIAFTLPFIIILYELCFFKSQNYELRTMNLRRLLYLLPFLLTLFIIPLSIVGIDKPIGDAIGELREAAQETEEIPRWSYLFTQFRVIVTYIRLLFLPVNQNLDYDYPIYNSFLNPNVFLSFLFLLPIFGLGVYLFYRSRYNPPHPPLVKGGMGGFVDSRLPTLDARLISFGIFWFFTTLSVESSIIPIKDVIFEHRLYLPSVGAAIAFVFTVFYVLQFTVNRSRIFTSYFPLLTSYFLLLFTIVVTLSIATYQRNTVWQDEVSLWEDVVKKSPEKARAHNNLGHAYHTHGGLDKGIEHYQIAIKLKPDFVEAYCNLGSAYSDKRLFERAIEYYQLALTLKPDYVEAYDNLGNAYGDKGWFDKAIEYHQIVIKLKPDYPFAHYNLGIAYEEKGLIDDAMMAYQNAIRLNPDYADAHNNLGVVYEKKGLLEEAIKEYRTAFRINPKDEIAKNNLNRILQIKR